jgi:hypothetical protein
MPAPTLARKTFSVSRLAEFASEAELVKQTGHPVDRWPLVIVKELVDNGLDACEEGGVAPEIAVTIEDGVIMVADNGPGMLAETVEKLLDFSVRTSSRAAYVSPTRGAQGNALQSLIAMPFVLGDDGAFIVESHGIARRVAFSIDPIRQTPRVELIETPASIVQGTRIALPWPNFADFDLDSPWSEPEAARSEFLQLAASYAWFNPHLKLSVEWRGPGDEVKIVREPTDLSWTKWLPSQPTSPHWYDEARLRQLIGAEIAYAEERGLAIPTAREFLTQFRGLSGSAKAKAICASLALERMNLADLSAAKIAPFLAAMRQASRPIKPKELGVIGREHLFKRFAEAGVLPESFDYRCAPFEDSGLPYVMEVAFGLRPDKDDDGPVDPDDDEAVAASYEGRGKKKAVIVEGANFSPAVGGSPFRLEGLLKGQKIDADEPVVAFVHVTSPRLVYLDRGKTEVRL